MDLDLQTVQQPALTSATALAVRDRRTRADRKARNRVAQRRPRREWLAAKHIRMKTNIETEATACCSWNANFPVGPRREAALAAWDKAMFGWVVEAASIAISPTGEARRGMTGTVRS
jgi:hypothetical protein